MTARETAGDVGIWYRPVGDRRWYPVGSTPDADQARAT